MNTILQGESQSRIFFVHFIQVRDVLADSRFPLFRNRVPRLALRQTIVQTFRRKRRAVSGAALPLWGLPRAALYITRVV